MSDDERRRARGRALGLDGGAGERWRRGGRRRRCFELGGRGARFLRTACRVRRGVPKKKIGPTESKAKHTGREPQHERSRSLPAMPDDANGSQ